MRQPQERHAAGQDSFASTSSVRGYAIALLLTVAALWVTVGLSLVQARPYAAPLAAIILSAWFGGFRPALLSLALAIARRSTPTWR